MEDPAKIPMLSYWLEPGKRWVCRSCGRQYRADVDECKGPAHARRPDPWVREHHTLADAVERP